MVTISFMAEEKTPTFETVKLADSSIVVAASKRLPDFKTIGEGLTAELPNFSAATTCFRPERLCLPFSDFEEALELLVYS